MATCGYVSRSILALPCKSEYLGCNGRCFQHCPHGLECHAKMLDIAGRGYDSYHANVRYMDIMDRMCEHGVACHGMPDNKVKPTHNGNGAYQGAFAFTLTKSPDDKLSEDDMIKAVTKIMNQQSIPVKKFAWYLEYGDEEQKAHPHIHGMYETETGGRIESKHFKRAWKIWDPKYKMGAGFRGGYHRPVRDNECYDDYIKKDGGKCERFNC